MCSYTASLPRKAFDDTLEVHCSSLFFAILNSSSYKTYFLPLFGIFLIHYICMGLKFRMRPVVTGHGSRGLWIFLHSRDNLRVYFHCGGHEEFICACTHVCVVVGEGDRQVPRQKNGALETVVGGRDSMTKGNKQKLSLSPSHRSQSPPQMKSSWNDSLQVGMKVRLLLPCWKRGPVLSVTFKEPVHAHMSTEQGSKPQVPRGPGTGRRGGAIWK